MASPAQAINALRQLELQDRISLQPTIVMFSAETFDDVLFNRMPYYRMLCDVAEVLVFNRCDQVNVAKLARIRRWADELDPPKSRVVTTTHGELPADLFINSTNTSVGIKPMLQEDHLHQFDSSAQPGGVICDAEQVFDETLLLANLQRLCGQGIAGNEVLRFKGVFRTEQGWRRIDIANGKVSTNASAYRGETLIEWVTRPEKIKPAQMLAAIERPIQPPQLTPPHINV